MKVGTILHGFAVQRVRELDELQAKLWEMEHIKSGAQLCWLERADENKAFSIAFKTLPEDSTGVFHILEHSVLCGSDKYPVKEPFVELLKSSVQTFLNAMTFPDKTVYPVSSRNDQDFLNLMDVYLDAVFHPAIYHRPEIFRQEGWRYEGDKDGLCYQGVVLNEMKGTFSNPESILRNTEKELLFPDTCYRFVSGGDPDRIPDLTYEAFIAAHKKYYHPSNSRISLVGSVEINSVLQKLDDFLREFDVSSEKTAIAYQKPVESVERTVSYAIGENESSHQRTIVSCASLMGTYRDRVRNYATAVLADYLTGDDDAPLKRAVLEQGLCQDFAVTVHDGMLQSLVSWEAWYTDQELLPHLRSTIHDTLTEIVKKGLDKERLDASLCQFAFRMRDRDSGGSPRSLNEALELLDTWLYGGDPAEGVTVEQPIRELLEKRDSGYFEELIRKLFLDNDHTVTVILVPSNTFSHEKAEREQQRITVAANRWTSAEWDTFAKETEALKQWQQTPDSEDALAAIPMLRLDDLPDAPEPVEVMQTHCQDIPMLCHKLPSELAHFRVHFLATDLETWELPALSIFCRLLGSMAAGRHSRSLLPLQIKRTLGQLDTTYLKSTDKKQSLRYNILAAGSEVIRVKVEIKMTETAKEPYAVIFTNEMTEAVRQAAAILEGAVSNKAITVTDNERIFVLRPEELYMLRVENERAAVYTRTKRFDSGRRLYEFEDMLGVSFMRISKSVLINLQYLECVEPTLGGLMMVTLKNGCKECISRKYLPAFKKYLGL